MCYNVTVNCTNTEDNFNCGSYFRDCKLNTDDYCPHMCDVCPCKYIIYCFYTGSVICEGKVYSAKLKSKQIPDNRTDKKKFESLDTYQNR